MINFTEVQTITIYCNFNNTVQKDSNILHGWLSVSFLLDKAVNSSKAGSDWSGKPKGTRGL
jgi:hypothetical protein